MFFKTRNIILVYLFALLEGTLARLINTTIYDTNVGHVSYQPQQSFCAFWDNYWFWKTCGMWTKPWISEVYRNGGRTISVHRSLNHDRASMTVEFEGSAIWLYGPPRAQLATIPPDYKVCLYERHVLASDETCYRVNIAAAYSDATSYDEPVVIFAKGGLRHQLHQVVISVGDPINDNREHVGIQFSHAVYTIERPTPWPVEEDHWRFRKVVMHDTHPLLTYHPKGRIPDCNSLWCWFTGQTDESGWSAKTYDAEDGSLVSWHELELSGEQLGGNQWGVEATITAGSVGVYGIPRAHIPNTSHLSQLCIQINSGRCDIVDVEHAYLNSKHEHESVLLWKHDALDASQKTHISIRLARGNERGVFAFKSIEYYETQEYAVPMPSVEYMQNIEIPHYNQEIAYHPGRRCVRHFLWWCTDWFDPWTWREEGPSGSRLSYRSTLWAYRATEDPSIDLDFRGSAVYVYGAPKGFIRNPFAPQHICINNACHMVDIEQAYLNAPMGTEPWPYSQDTSIIRGVDASRQHPNETLYNTTLSSMGSEYEPVLIWSMSGLDDRLSHRLKLSLAGLPSEGRAEMTIAKVVYTKLKSGYSHSEPPIPQPDPRYTGPIHPPYAQKWMPHTPSPAPPAPTHPTTPPNIPAEPKEPQNPSPDSQGENFLDYLLVFIVSIVGAAAACFLVLLVIGVRIGLSSRQEERERLIRDAHTAHSFYSARNSANPSGHSTADPSRPARRPADYGPANPALHRSTFSPNNTTRNILDHGSNADTLSQTPTAGRLSWSHSIPSPGFSPPSYADPPPYTRTPAEAQTTSPAASTVLPSYAQIVRENEARAERAAAYAPQQRILYSQQQPAALASPEVRRGANLAQRFDSYVAPQQSGYRPTASSSRNNALSSGYVEGRSAQAAYASTNVPAGNSRGDSRTDRLTGEVNRSGRGRGTPSGNNRGARNRNADQNNVGEHPRSGNQNGSNEGNGRGGRGGRRRRRRH